MASNKAKSFRRRGGDSSDEEEGDDSGPALLRRPPARPGGASGGKKKVGGVGAGGSTTSSSSKLAGGGSSSSLAGSGGAGGAGAAPASSKKASMLSFEEDEEGGEEGGGGGGGLQALKSKAKPKKKKAFASRSLEKAMQEMESEAAAGAGGGGDGAAGAASSFFASGAGAGGGGGEYTAEKLAALRKGQNFQVSTKPAKGAGGGDKGKRVTFVAPDVSEGVLPSGHEEVGDEELDKEEVARLKREKRERMRREALAAGGGEGGGAGLDVGSGDEEGEDFIPLDGGQRLSKGERRLERAGLAGEQDVEVEDDWESEMIRRGARKPSAASAAAAAAASNGGALSSSLGRLVMGVGGPGGAAPPAFKTVEGVLRELRTTKERVDEAHAKNERAAAQAQGDLEAARAACGKLQGEFDETAARFQFFQDTREYLSSLCGCLREKQGMVAELEAAVAQVRRDAAERRWARRVEDQEDALEELKAQGALRSLQGYRPTVVRGLVEGEEGAAWQSEPVDEFGRDRSVGEEATRARRRQARLARREKLLARVRQAKGNGKGDAAAAADTADTAEAEARWSGGEESESEAAQTRARRRKLLEAAGVIFEDAAEEFSGVGPVAARFELWKRRHPRDYQTAYVSAALPQVFEPLVRVEMARWDPLALEEGGQEEVATALEGFAWYERLFAFGQGPEGEEGAPPPPPPQEGEDPDERLVPTLVEKVAVQLLQKLLAEAYDPLSGRETARAVAAVQAVLIYEPGKHAMEDLLKAPLERLKQAARALCVPLLQPPPEAPSAEAGAFQRRQIFRAVKLYANVGAWHEVLAARALAPVALGELLEGVLAPALADRVAADVSAGGGAGGGAGASSPAALEALGTLEALLTATPPALLLEKSAPALTRTFEVLDRIGQQAGQAAPVMSTVKRLRAGFGGGSN